MYSSRGKRKHQLTAEVLCEFILGLALLCGFLHIQTEAAVVEDVIGVNLTAVAVVVKHIPFDVIRIRECITSGQSANGRF